MKNNYIKLLLSILVTYTVSASACDAPVVKCVCYPAIPFEGFQVYVHEKCGATEGSYRYGETMYDTQSSCQQWISEDANCQSLR